MKSAWKYKSSATAKSIFRKNSGAGGITLPDFPHSQTVATLHTVLRESKVLAEKEKYRSVGKDKNPQIKPCIYSKLMYSERGKNIKWRKDSLLTKQCWANATVTRKRMELEHFLIPHTNINSKCIHDLNIRPDIIKLPEENTGRTLLTSITAIPSGSTRVMEIKQN